MGARHARTGTRILLSALGAALVSVVATVGAAHAEPGDGISASGATVDKVGWWHEKNVATSTPAANVTVPPPPGVPDGTLAVGALNGEPDRLTAVGILPEAVPGDTITSFSLTIKEAGPPAVNANSSAAKIVACPITAFWVEGANGVWDSRPEYDCELAKAPGARAEDGTWTFDLLAIGQAWTDPAGTIAADGIVLVEDVAGPEGFQTVFATEGEGALVVALESTDGTSLSEAPFDPSLGGSTDPSFDSGSFDSGPGSFEVPEIGSSEVPVGGLPAPGTTSPPPPESDPPLAAAPVAQTGPNVLGNLPGGLVLAVPVFLVLFGLLSFSLGPAGEPVAASRQRGVSRALASHARPTAPIPSPEAF